MVVAQDALARIPEGLTPEEAGPLMCAGLTTFTALRNSSAKPGQLVAIIGVGGLGHLGTNEKGLIIILFSYPVCQTDGIRSSCYFSWKSQGRISQDFRSSSLHRLFRSKRGSRTTSKAWVSFRLIMMLTNTEVLKFFSLLLRVLNP